MENLVAFKDAYRGRKVWVSGHTGFKGAWLAQWLTELGAEVHGFALPPATTPALFDQLALAERVNHEMGDIRDLPTVRHAIERAQPDFVFHAAAQALVRASYDEPVETYATNLMGTVNILESLRGLRKPCAAIFMTSDKCYDNDEQARPFAEHDPLGGHDPYSSSKAAAELAIAAYRRSFFRNHPVKIASVRAGNVIGGGDWARDRIVPDCVRALQEGCPISVRNPNATRPWQHVLEPLSGYLWLAVLLAQSGEKPAGGLSGAFNFGPGEDGVHTVRELVERILSRWPGTWVDASQPGEVHEARFLSLSTVKARSLLGWRPVWNLSQAVQRTIDWYQAGARHQDVASIRRMTMAEIDAYAASAKTAGLVWAQGRQAEERI